MKINDISPFLTTYNLFATVANQPSPDIDISNTPGPADLSKATTRQLLPKDALLQLVSYREYFNEFITKDGTLLNPYSQRYPTAAERFRYNLSLFIEDTNRSNFEVTTNYGDTPEKTFSLFPVVRFLQQDFLPQEKIPGFILATLNKHLKRDRTLTFISAYRQEVSCISENLISLLTTALKTGLKITTKQHTTQLRLLANDLDNIYICNLIESYTLDAYIYKPNGDIFRKTIEFEKDLYPYIEERLILNASTKTLKLDSIIINQSFLQSYITNVFFTVDIYPEEANAKIYNAIIERLMGDMKQFTDGKLPASPPTAPKYSPASKKVISRLKKSSYNT